PTRLSSDLIGALAPRRPTAERFTARLPPILPGSGGDGLPVLGQKRRRGGVRDRHVVVSGQLAKRVRESAARDDPVEDLDALAAGQLDDVERAVPGERLGVRENVTEAEPVVVGVDMAGALAVELVRQAAGAE